MKKQRLACLALAVAIGCGVMSGCGNTGNKTADGSEKITLPIGAWVRQEENPEGYAQSLEWKAEFEAQNPEYVVEPVEWSYDISTFLPKAAAGELPIYYDVAFTEVKRISDSGYAADVSNFLDQYGYSESVKEEIWELLTYDGMRAFLPTSTYTESLFINKNLFTQAGLVNEDGSVKIPQTYDEMLEFAGIIKEKTGQAGYAIPTTGRQGGWAFMNIAWSYGTEFMKQDENGKWIATFDSPACAEALNVLKRARFEYDAVPPNILLNPGDLLKLFAVDQLAMFIIPPPQSALVQTYGMDPNDIIVAKVPAGPHDRSTLLGGGLLAFSSGYTQEQYEGAFKWIEFIGNGVTVTEEQRQKREQDYQLRKERNEIIGIPEYTFWKDNVERVQLDKELREKYATIDVANAADYVDEVGLVIRPEEPANCQQLYEVLDTCIQNAYESADSDIEKILKDANEFFQKNYLDKSKY